MKNQNFIFLLLMLFSLTAKAVTSKNIYKLNNPISAFDSTYKYMKWRFVSYPENNIVYWCIPKDTSKNLCMIDGVIEIPDTVINNYFSNQLAIPQYIESIEPWEPEQ